MTNHNTIVCSNCGEVNLLYDKNCINCKHYLRSAVINIDLWITIWGLFENPTKSLKNIIKAEHKNFIVFLLLFLSFKLYLTSVTLQSAFFGNELNTDYYWLNLFSLTAIYLVINLLFSFVVSKIYSKRVKNRFKDNLTILVYSFIPIIFSLLILSPVEYALFGKHWFLYNPSPFLIKNTLAYMMLGLEIIMLVWGIIIYYIGLKIQSNSIIISLVSIFIYIAIMITAMLNIPFIIL